MNSLCTRLIRGTSISFILQAKNRREKEDQLIAQNIQETGSSGWLSTRQRANERVAAITAARAIAQAANQNRYDI
jgi:hypothetical protein